MLITDKYLTCQAVYKTVTMYNYDHRPQVTMHSLSVAHDTQNNVNVELIAQENEQTFTIFSKALEQFLYPFPVSGI